MEELIIAMSAITGVVWMASEFLGRALSSLLGRPIDKSVVAVVLGPAAGALAHGVGWVFAGEGVWGWVAAIYIGLIATALAGAGHDKVIKPAAKLVGKGGTK